MEVLTLTEVLLRIGAAAAFGGIVGIEREYNDQPAGFRTHILVSLGAALFTLTGAYAPLLLAGEQAVRFDPTRVAAQVVTGIGFLGAGAILRTGVNVRGLTTAASIWVTAAIGTAAALGYWEAATATTVLTLLSLLALKPLERALLARTKRALYRIVVDVGPEGDVSQVVRAVEGHGGVTRSIKISEEADGQRQLVIGARFRQVRDFHAAVETIGALDDIERVDAGAH